MPSWPRWQAPARTCWPGSGPPAGPRVLHVLPDGSCLAEVAGLRVRLIEAAVTVTGADGTRWADRYRLVTTLADHRRYPAGRLVRLYHERWEIESAYYALRHTLLAGRVLRSGDRPGLEQEIGPCSPPTSCSAWP